MIVFINSNLQFAIWVFIIIVISAIDIKCDAPTIKTNKQQMDLSNFDLVSVNVLRCFWLNANFCCLYAPENIMHTLHISPVFSLCTFMYVLNFEFYYYFVSLSHRWLNGKLTWWPPSYIINRMIVDSVKIKFLYMKSNLCVKFQSLCTLQLQWIPNGKSKWKMSYRHIKIHHKMRYDLFT